MRACERACVRVYLEGHVGDVHQLVVCEGQQVEEAQLREGSWLDLLHAVPVDHQLLQRGEAVEGLLHAAGQRGRRAPLLVFRKGSADEEDERGKERKREGRRKEGLCVRERCVCVHACVLSKR